MPSKARVAVIGAGPAGLAAVQILLRQGADVVLIDENRRFGGRFLAHDRAEHIRGWPREVRSVPWLQQAKDAGCRFMPRAQVLGMDPQGFLVLEDERGRVQTVQAEISLMAPGARERCWPFPGWTLPGVMTTGAVQLLGKESGLLPQGDLVVGGSTPLAYALAAETAAGSRRVRAVLDESGMPAGFSLAAAALKAGGPLAAMAKAISRLAIRRIPVYRRHRILAARGQRELEEVVAVQTDARGADIPQSETVLPAQILAVGHGFVPNVELPAQAGCHLVQDVYPGIWAVAVDERMQTSVPGIYAAGEVTGIGGSGKAFLEGQLAAWAIVRHLGLGPKKEAGRIIRMLHTKRRTWLAYGRAVHRYCHPPGQNLDRLPDEMILCRCENVTLGQVRAALRQGFSTVGALKKASRCGMGMCQGRMCGPIVSEMLAAEVPERPVHPPSVRMPVKAVAVESLIQGDGEESCLDRGP